MPTIEFWLAFLMLITPVSPRCNVAAIADEYRPRAYDLAREHGRAEGKLESQEKKWRWF